MTIRNRVSLTSYRLACWLAGHGVFWWLVDALLALSMKVQGHERTT